MEGEPCRVMTPWDMADHVVHVAPGIDIFSTPGHGGVRLSDERQAVIKRRFPHFVTFTTHQGWPSWYEEDADICVVMAAFPTEMKVTPERLKQVHAYILRDNDYFHITQEQLDTL